ncbi:hypothetical protein C8Q73DRAFT_619173, partial [Cubamyces lactineus]
RFVRRSLCDLGLVIQLGHREDRNITDQYVQLLREGWFPATTSRPATVFTFDLLATFQELNFQAKTNLHDYLKTLERLTDNSGTKVPPPRYRQFSHCMRLHRYITMLKRSGRGHDPSGIDTTGNGDLAVECPACPHPGKNLPSDWKTAPASDRYVPQDHPAEHSTLPMLTVTQENRCSAEHNAIVKAHLHKQGYVASGVVAVLCARHALVRPNGAGDMQKGERYANTDFVLFSTLKGSSLGLLLSYDIACQWSRNLLKRMHELPEELQLDVDAIPGIRYSIPKKHYRVHGPNHSQYSLNYQEHVGRTYGEGIESQWSHLNPIALSTREMSPGARSDFLRALRDAREMRTVQQRNFEQYSSAFKPDLVAQWEKMIETWNQDPSKPDPYEETTISISMKCTKLQLAMEEEKEYTEGTLPAHEVTPGIFLQLGLDLEEQQRALLYRARDQSTISTIAEVQEKRTALLRRIELWQVVQDVHMAMVPLLRNSEASTGSSSGAGVPPARVKAEYMKLWLPSSLPPQYRQLPTLAALVRKEARLRLAQLSDSLEDIRRYLRVLTGITEFKRLNVSGAGQRMSGRIRSLYSRFQDKVTRATERYCAARTALEALDPQGDWSARFKPLLKEDIRGPVRDDTNASEGRHQTSWIWLSTTPADPQQPSPPLTESTKPEEFIDSMRLSLGLQGYAEKQAAVLDTLRLRFASMWVPYLKGMGPLPAWAKAYGD